MVFFNYFLLSVKQSADNKWKIFWKQAAFLRWLSLKKKRTIILLCIQSSNSKTEVKLYCAGRAESCSASLLGKWGSGVIFQTFIYIEHHFVSISGPWHLAWLKLSIYNYCRQNHLYISPALSYLYQCNEKHAHLGRQRVVFSKKYRNFINFKLPNRPETAQILFNS